MAEITSNSGKSEIGTELAERRTGMAFQRTRMAADRTLMAMIRTSLSLIGFGFTIFQFFKKLKIDFIQSHDNAPRNFGLSLLFLGIALLIGGIVYHWQFMSGLRNQRNEMSKAGLVHAESVFPISLILIVAILLLLLGVLTIISMTFNAGPLS
jgi:putative membrane protein